jgi:hypothetical protein
MACTNAGMASLDRVKKEKKKSNIDVELEPACALPLLSVRPGFMIVSRHPTSVALCIVQGAGP